MQAVILTRVSSREQEETGYSLDSQKKLLSSYAATHDLNSSKVFAISESASGSKQREIFNEMMAYVKKHDIKAVVCEKVDRLTRNFKDAVMIDNWLEADETRQLHLVKDNLILHKNSRSQEKLTWGLRVILAKNYTDNLSEEVKKGQIEKAAQGWWPQKAKLGYRTILRDGSRHKITIQDPAKAPLLKQALELYETGNYSIKALAEKMYELGLRSNKGNKVGKSRMAGFLSDPFYYGKILWKGKLYQGEHEPLILEEQFERIQDIAQRKTTPKYSKHSYMFKGLINCVECNGTITWSLRKGIMYGRCNHYRACSQKICAKEKEVESKLTEALSSLRLQNPRLIEWIGKALKEHHQTEVVQHEASVDELNRNLKRLETKLEQIYDDKLEGLISKERYTRKNTELVAEKEQVERQLQKYSKAHTQYHDIGAKVYDLAQRGGELYAKATDDEKRNLTKLVFANLTLDNGKLNYRYTEPFEILSKAIAATNSSKVLKTELDVAKIFEPIKHTVNTKQKQVLQPAFESMRE